MHATSRRGLAMTACGVLGALALGIPSHAQGTASAEPSLAFDSAVCGTGGDLEVGFLLTDPAASPDPFVVADVDLRTGSGSSPWRDAELGGTLRPGAQVPTASTGSLSARAPVPGDAGRVELRTALERTSEDGRVERVELRAESLLDDCAPKAPEPMEAPDHVRGPYGQKLTIPTHVSPAGGQTTHPSVVRVPGGWNGYEYWMAHTPYPSSDSAHEDPNIAASHDGVTWVVPDGMGNPIDDQPGLPGPYNSDTDLQMGPDDTMYVFWRVVIPAASQERIKYASSTDGVTWSAPVEAMRSAMSAQRPVSPALLYEDGRWVMWAIDIRPSPNRMVYYEGGDTPAKSEWGAASTVSLGAMQPGKEPWHVSVVKDGDAYVGLLNDTATGTTGRDGDLIFITGSSPTAFANSQGTAIPRFKPNMHDHLYRATMLADTEDGRPGYRVWYSARMALDPDVWNLQRTFIHAHAARP